MGLELPFPAFMGLWSIDCKVLTNQHSSPTRYKVLFEHGNVVASSFTICFHLNCIYLIQLSHPSLFDYGHHSGQIASAFFSSPSRCLNPDKNVYSSANLSLSSVNHTTHHHSTSCLAYLCLQASSHSSSLFSFPVPLARPPLHAFTSCSLYRAWCSSPIS